MEILVVRHGQSQADLEDRHEGRADFPLTQLGEQQASLAAEWIANNHPPDLVISSTLKRAQRTAEVIARASEAPLLLDTSLMEWNNGLLAGLLRAEAAWRFPLPKGGRRPHDTFAETESLIDFRARAETFWSRFNDEYVLQGQHQRIALVSHGGMINMLFHCFLSLPMAGDVVFGTGDTGIHLWRITPNERIVVFTNSQEHLAAVK